MKDISLHQRIWNAMASQEVENVKGRHAYLHGRADTNGEWCTIWSKSDNISWGHGFGRMRGFDQVWHGSIAQYDMHAMNNWLETVKVYPEIAGKDPRPIMECSVHTLVTDGKR